MSKTLTLAFCMTLFVGCGASVNDVCGSGTHSHSGQCVAEDSGAIADAAVVWDGALPPNEVHGDVGGLRIGTSTVFQFAVGECCPGDPAVMFSNHIINCNLFSGLERNETQLRVILSNGRGLPLPATVKVMSKGASAATPRDVVGLARVQSASDGCVLTEVEATDGTLTVLKYEEDSLAKPSIFAGTFDLAFPTGRLQGSFTSYPCSPDAGPMGSVKCL